MRIATLANASVVHTRRWVEHFRARGHDVRVWSLEPPMPGFDAERVVALPLPGFLRYPAAAPAVARALDAFAPDLVDAHFVPNYGLLATLAGRRPLSVTAWGSDLLVAGARDPLQRRRARFVLSRADLVLADAPNLADAARRLGARPERLHCIPWGVDRARFHPAPRRQPGLLLSTRMHEPIYDLPALFAGVAPLLRERPALALVVAGDGSQRAALEVLARRTLPPAQVQFVGRLAPEVMAEWLSRADVYLSASHSDSTSQSLLEAMACGALPVVSDIPGNREWVEFERTARGFAPGDAAGVTRALRAALDDAAWADAARVRNAAVVAERGDWHRNLARIEALFEALAGTAGRGAHARSAG